MPPLTATKKDQLFRNLLQGAGLYRERINYPVFHLVDDHASISVICDKKHLDLLLSLYVPKDSLVRLSEYLNREGIDYLKINQGLEDLARAGVKEANVILAKRDGHCDRSNPTHVFVQPNWDAFNEQDYLFECRELIFNEGN